MADIFKVTSDFLMVIYYWLEAIVLWLVPRRLRFKDITGEIVLITGAGSGLGRLLALRFARRGAVLVLWDITDEGNAETAEMVRKLGGQATTYHVNVTDRDAVYKAAAKVKDEVGIVTILVNNAGIVNGKNFLELPDQMIERTFQVNAVSHFWTIKAFLNDMLVRDKGHIVSICSLAGLGGIAQLSDYCASKFAAVGLLESLTLELHMSGKHDIHTTTVCPYFINTGMFEGAGSRLFSMLEPDYVADEIMAAILVNQQLVLMPRIFYFLITLKTLLPSRALLALHDACGSSKAMANFRGREKSQ